MSLNKIKMIFRYFHTLRYLKLSQILYQIIYRFKSIFKSNSSIILNTESINEDLIFKNVIFNKNSYAIKNSFNFLNKEMVFEGEINWNFYKYGKLWTYNLNYFDFLNQEAINSDDAIKIIKSFVLNYNKIIDAKEPYPTSIRIINLIKFVSSNKIKDRDILNLIITDIKRLRNNIEYHLLGNHILENAFALFLGSVFLSDKKLYNYSSNLLKYELKEQILDDGAHFELSPTYHNHILFRVLDSINFILLNNIDNDLILDSLIFTAKKMFSWIKNISYRDGKYPMVNDSTYEISPNLKQLSDYFKFLKLSELNLDLSVSGFRLINEKFFQLFIDISSIASNYQPGHSHADTFNFELYVDNKPILVDTGISTYDLNDFRKHERGTSAHNTVSVEQKNSSDVWSSFRVGLRAEVKNINEQKNCLKAEHTGFEKLGFTHKREWEWSSNNIIIRDSISNSKKIASAFFHFHDSVILLKNDDELIINNKVKIHFEKFNNINFIDSYVSKGFNKRSKNISLKVNFNNELVTKISINE